MLSEYRWKYNSKMGKMKHSILYEKVSKKLLKCIKTETDVNERRCCRQIEINRHLYF